MISAKGKVITVRGPVDPSILGRVLMHEHLNSDIYDWKTNSLITEEKPSETRREYLMKEAAPLLKQCGEYGCHAFLDATMGPWRAWPTVYRDVSEAAGAYIIMSTGFYREMELGTYWVKAPRDRIWPFVIDSTAEELGDMCTKEILEGIHGTGICAGAVKLATSAADITELEKKTFRAGALAQKRTGVHVTTHCTKAGAETSQLTLLEKEGVDLNRCVIGHTAGHLMDPAIRKTCLEWMKRGANFLPTNLGIKVEDNGKVWQPLVDAIHRVFDAGFGDHLVLGLDSGYCSESGEFGPVTFLPPSPFLHMFTHTLPAFRRMGLTPEEERWMMEKNPQRILPVQ